MTRRKAAERSRARKIYSRAKGRQKSVFADSPPVMSHIKEEAFNG